MWRCMLRVSEPEHHPVRPDPRRSERPVVASAPARAMISVNRFPFVFAGPLQEHLPMPMTARVARLRQQSLDAMPTLSSERARLITDWYASHTDDMSAPLRRALAFRHLLERVTVRIHPDELIVGEKGPLPKAAPTYPELCCHTLDDLDILDAREKTSFRVSAAERDAYAGTIIPFWKGRTMRERIFGQMTEAWRAGYEAGVFTEFMEQRSPGHTVLDDKLYRKGLVGLLADIDVALVALDFQRDPTALSRRDQLQAMALSARAVIHLASRYALEARSLATSEPDQARRAELQRIADVCEHVPASPPRTFHEALQAYWFIHLGVTLELNPWDAFSPGKLDQHLSPYYERGLADGTLTREGAEELLQCLWVKFNNQPAPPKVGVTAEESGTYTDFAQVNLGGVRPDGSDGVNKVTHLLLDVVEEMRLLQPSASIHVSERNPDAFVKRAGRIIRTGFGQPSVFNNDVVVQEMLRQNKSLADARQGGTSGCVETGAFGKENYCLTGYFNLPKVLELTLHDGLDPQTGRQLGPHTGRPEQLASYTDLWSAFETTVRVLGRRQGARQPRHRAALCGRHACAVSVAPDRRLRQPRARLSRWRRALQHLVYPGCGAGHHDRCVGSGQVTGVRRRRRVAGGACGRTGRRFLGPGAAAAASAESGAQVRE